MRGTGGAPPGDIRAEFVAGPPTSQNAVDLFRGSWVSRFPESTLVNTGGTMNLFDDPRVSWMLDQLGSVEGLSILELGPLEGGHSWMLEQAGFRRVVAIEANPHAFLKCLVTKEVTGLERVEFRCGDFVDYLRAPDEAHDVVLASGVLYHMADPVDLLRLIANTASTVTIWTHVFDEAAFAARPDLDELFIAHISNETAGFVHTLHQRRYREDGIAWDSFHGGAEQAPGWLTLEDLTRALQHFGFTEVRYGPEQPDHPHGPAVTLVASAG